LQKKLAQIAPNICIKTVWSRDEDYELCDGFEDVRKDGHWAWSADITATLIQNGEEITGKAGMSGVWQAPEDLPWLKNPDISGYEAQMTEEALSDLLETVSFADRVTRNQIHNAIDQISND
jgi:hypothetical protein